MNSSAGCAGATTIRLHKYSIQVDYLRTNFTAPNSNRGRSVQTIILFEYSRLNFLVYVKCVKSVVNIGMEKGED